jgi:hypothetical protein
MTGTQIMICSAKIGVYEQITNKRLIPPCLTIAGAFRDVTDSAAQA